MLYLLSITDQLAQIKGITHAKVLCSVLKDDHGDISYQARLFKRQHQERWVIMKILEYEKFKKLSLFFSLERFNFIQRKISFVKKLNSV